MKENVDELKDKIDSMYPLIFRGQQLQIWNTLHDLPLSTGTLSTITNIPSNNVSKQLSQMSRTGLVKFIQNGKLKSWYR